MERDRLVGVMVARAFIAGVASGAAIMGVVSIIALRWVGCF